MATSVLTLAAVNWFRLPGLSPTVGALVWVGMVILTLALAQARALGQQGGQAPLLLFDEACAHLDAPRREGLAREILATGSQAWLTGVERVLFEPFGGRIQYFEVDAAEVTRC